MCPLTMVVMKFENINVLFLSFPKAAKLRVGEICPQQWPNNQSHHPIFVDTI